MSDQPTDAEERLARMRQEQSEEKAGAPNLLKVGFPLLLLFAVFVYFLPDLMSTQADGARMLERSLAYCKYSESQKVCESRITKRHDLCQERTLAYDGPADVYGTCMEEEFPDYYATVAQHLPKRVDL